MSGLTTSRRQEPLTGQSWTPILSSAPAKVSCPRDYDIQHMLVFLTLRLTLAAKAQDDAPGSSYGMIRSPQPPGENNPGDVENHFPDMRHAEVSFTGNDSDFLYWRSLA